MADLYNKAQWIFVAGANKSGSIYGIGPITGSSNVTLISGSTTRASSGSRTNSSGIIEGVAPHILRVDYPDLVTCPSYKFEPDRTNYLYNSDHVSASSNTSYVNVSWSLATDSTSPVGTGFTGFIRENPGNTGTLGHYLRIQNGASSANQNFACSIYVKRSGSGADTRNISILPGALSEGTGVFFILDGTGSIYTPAAPNTYISGAYIEPLQNGWYRCSVLANNFGLGNFPELRVYITSGSTYEWSYNGNGQSGMYMCGAQLESGSSMGNRDINTYNTIYNWGTPITAYISSSATVLGVRNAADRTILLPSSSNSSAWTAFVAYRQADPSPQAQSALFTVLSGSNYAGFYAGGRPISTSGVSGSQVFTNIEHKLALRLSGSQLTWYRDGSRLHSITWPTTGTWGNYHLGSFGSSTETFAGRGSFFVRVAAMFNQDLSDAECISLTTTGSGTSIV